MARKPRAEPWTEAARQSPAAWSTSTRVTASGAEFPVTRCSRFPSGGSNKIRCPLVSICVPCGERPFPAALFRLLEQFFQILLPYGRPRMRAMAVRLIRDWDQHKLPVRHSFDLAFSNPQFRRIDEVVGRVHEHHRHLDRFQLR